MSLSVYIVTRDSAGHIERLLRSIREVADELVIGVDSRSVDATQELCRRYADKLFRLEPFGNTMAITRAWMIEQCRGDWLLNLDDDELLSTRLVQALPDLMMKDPTTTHYWFRERWLAWPDGTRWLSGPVWAPDWQMRFYRRGPQIFTEGKAHTRCEVPGDGRFSIDGCIYHLDHLLRTPEYRLAKAQRYERSAPGNQNWDAYVIPEGFVPPTQPVPADDPPWESEASDLPRCDAQVRVARFEDIEQALARSHKPDSMPPVPLPTIPPVPEFFRARLEWLDETRTMAAGQPVWLSVRVHNDGPIPWGRFGTPYPQVRVTCHWLRPDGRVRWFDAGRSQPSCVVQPGDEAIVPIWILPPNQPGQHCLQWDLVMEDVGWFSQHDWGGPEHQVYAYRAVTPLSPHRATVFQDLFGVDAAALDGESSNGSSMQRLMQVEAGRRALEETIATLTASLSGEEASHTRAMGALSARLAESEADRAARLEVIQSLTAHRATLEAACAERLELIDRLTAHIAMLEAECAARLKVINQLTTRDATARTAWRAIRRRFKR